MEEYLAQFGLRDEDFTELDQETEVRVELPPEEAEEPEAQSDGPGFLTYAWDGVKGLAKAVPHAAVDLINLGNDLLGAICGYDAKESELRPEWLETDTAVGTFTREAGAFAVGLLTGSVVLNGLSKVSKLGKIAKAAQWMTTAAKGELGVTRAIAANAGKGAWADFAHGDTNHENLSNLVESFPLLKNPVTAFLAHEGDDGNLEKRLKNAAEGIPLGVAADYLFTGLKKLLALKRGQIDLQAGDDALMRERLTSEMVGDPVMTVPHERAYTPVSGETAQALEETASDLPKWKQRQKELRRKKIERNTRKKQEAREALTPEAEETIFANNQIPAHPALTQERYTISNQTLSDPKRCIALYTTALEGGADASDRFIRNLERSTVSREQINILAAAFQTVGKSAPQTMNEMAERAITPELKSTLEDFLKNGLGVTNYTREMVDEMGKLSGKTLVAVQQMRVLTTASSQRALSIARDFVAKKGTASVTDADRLMMINSFLDMSHLVETLGAARGDLGRALKLNDSTVDATGIYVKSAIVNRKQGGAKTLGKLLAENAEGLDPKVLEDADRLAELLVKHADAISKGHISRVVEKKHAKGYKVWRTIQEYRITNMLSGTTTHAVDRIGTALHQLAFAIEQPLASAIGLFRGTEDRMLVSEALSAIPAQFDGIKYFFRSFGKTFGTDMSDQGFLKALGDLQLTSERAGLGKRDLSRMKAEFGSNVPAISSEFWGIENKTLGALVDVWGKIQRTPSLGVMALGDAMSETQAIFGAVESLSRTKSRLMGIKPGGAHATDLRNHTLSYIETGKMPDLPATFRQAPEYRLAIEDIAKEARRQGQWATYKQGFHPDSVSSKINHWLNRTDAQIPLACRTFLAPFVKTPLNIIDDIVVHTPFLQKMASEYKTVMQSGSKQAKDLMYAKATVGTMMYSGAGALVLGGYLTGAHDPADRQHLIAAGIPEYAIRFGNTYYTYNRLDPLGMFCGIVADLHSASRFLDHKEYMQGMATAVGALVKHTMYKTYARGFAELFSVLLDSSEGRPEAIQKYLASQGGSFTPLLGLQKTINLATGGVNPELKETRDTVDRWIAQTVFASSLPDRRDAFGNPVFVEWTPLQLLTGISRRTYTESPFYQELAKYRAFPEDKPGTVMGVKLSKEEHLQFKENMKKLNANERLDKYVQSESYLRLSDAERAKALRKAVSSYRSVAKKMLLQNEATHDRITRYRRALSLIHDLEPDVDYDSSSSKAVRDYSRRRLKPDQEDYKI